MSLARATLAVILLASAVALAWRLGERHGAGRVPPPTAQPTADAVLLARLARLEGEREMDRATIESLRIELERVGELAAAERAELALYRRIGGEGGPDGLAIDALERRQGESATLLVTLIQARGRERVRGRVEVRPLATVEAPSTVTEGREPSASPDGEAAADDGAAARSGLDAPWQRSFDFRFFQTLEVPLPDLGEGFPPAIEVSVLPEGESYRPFRQRFRREDVRRRE